MNVVYINGDQTVASNRQLAAEGTGLYSNYWQQSKPIMPAELNLSQHLGHERRRQLGSLTTRAGLFQRGAFAVGGTPGGTNTLTLTIPTDYVSVNGETLRLATASDTAVVVSLSDRSLGGTTYDVVFLEMWYAEIAPVGTAGVATELYPNGWADSPTDLNSDANAATKYSLKDPQVSGVAETSRRIALRWRVRVTTSSTNPTTILSGDSLLAGDGIYGLSPRGGAATPQGGYSYANQAYPLQTLYRAGGGLVADAQALKSVDGYVYAVPIAYVTHLASDGLGVITLGMVTDRRKSSSPLSNIGTDGTNTSISGDDIIFYRADGVTETGRVIGSGGTPYKIRTHQFVSIATGSTPPFVVGSTTQVANLNASLLVGRSPGNAAQNIPIANGTMTVGLNAEMVGGVLAFNSALAPGSQTNQPNMLAIIGPSGKLPSNLITFPSTSVASFLLDDVDGVTQHPSSHYWRKAETVLFATSAGSAGSANFATQATRATIANAIDSQQNSATTRASITPDGNTIPLRDNVGNIYAPVVYGDHFTGLADEADTLDDEHLHMPTDSNVLFLPSGNYQTYGNAATWGTPQLTRNGWAQHDDLGRFVMAPSRYKFKVFSGQPYTTLTAKLYGTIYYFYDPAAESPASYTFGLRLYAPNQVGNGIPGTAGYYPVGSPIWGYSQTVAPGGSFRLEELGAPTFTVDRTGLHDGMWLVRIISTKPGGENFWCSNLHIRYEAT